MKITVTVLLLVTATFMMAQDTIQYKCSLRAGKKMLLLYESLQLYPDGTFAQTSEYDLYFHQFGKYTTSNDTLILSLYGKVDLMIGSDYKTIGRVVDSLAQIAPPDEVKKYRIENDALYILKPGGNIQKRITDNSLAKPFGWLLGNGHRYYYRKEPLTPFDN